MRSAFLPGCLAGLILLAGCGKPPAKFDDLHPVTGTILTSEGKPVEAGVVVFEADPPKADFLTNSEVGSGGTFKLTTVRTNDSQGERKPGAPAGKYKVTFTPKLGDQTAGYQAPVTLPNPVTVEAKSNDLKLTLPAKK